MRAVVMAGGEGTRLRPLTSNQPKPMVPIVGKPCMEHILELLRDHGFADVVITVAFLPQAIRILFRRRLEPRPQHRVLRRGDPARHRRLGAARERAARRHDPRHLRRRALRHRPRRDRRRRTARRAPQSRSGSSRSRTRSSSGSSSPTRTAASSASSRSRRGGRCSRDTINTGIYVLEPEVLRHIPTDRPYDFSKELFPLLLEMGRPIYGHVCDGYWQDIGNLDQYRQANFDALDEKVRLNDPGLKIRGDVWIGEGVEIDDVEGRRGAGVHRQLLTDLARVVGRAVHACSARRSRCASAPASRARSIDASCYIGRSAMIEGAILGRNCDVRPHARVHEGVAIGDQVTLGDQSVDLPGRADLPVQGGRVRRADPREPDLGVARHDAPLRAGRRRRARSTST